MSDGFRLNIGDYLSELTTEQIKQLIATMDCKLTEVKRMVVNNLSPTAAESLLRNIGESLEYEIAIMTNDQETLAKYQSIDD